MLKVSSQQGGALFDFLEISKRAPPAQVRKFYILSMSFRADLISDVTDAMRIELTVKRTDRMTVEEINHKIKEREREFQYIARDP